ncbi:threonine-phosphate decarboxylase CobD [Vibrio maritimus]|uniref:threonine-phosphate decarboxylase CobD n=1 Tax=Vibrio maritimus TaxID=990268 RepID=UPI0037361D46
MIHHGGNLIKAINEYGGEPNGWLDISTGVSPFTYPVPVIPDSIWNRLPQSNDGLERAARFYYRSASEPLAVAGSQAAIASLPELFTSRLKRLGTVCLPRVGYKEHQRAWETYRYHGSQWLIEFYDETPSVYQLENSDVVVIINPNNPTGQRFSQSQLDAMYQKMQINQGYLVIDEAFADCTPENSLLRRQSLYERLLVLRSVGKFFGLAGARVGFVFAMPPLLSALENQLGPWTVTGPSRWVVKTALMDTDWQLKTRQSLAQNMKRLHALLIRTLTKRVAYTDLFITAYVNEAAVLHRHLCERQVLTRLCDERNALRFGLPRTSCQWAKLESALLAVSKYQKELVHES